MIMKVFCTDKNEMWDGVGDNVFDAAVDALDKYWPEWQSADVIVDDLKFRCALDGECIVFTFKENSDYWQEWESADVIVDDLKLSCALDGNCVVFRSAGRNRK